MKIFSAQEMRELDAQTILKEPISSIDLMERASSRLVDQILQLEDNNISSVSIFCGPGNNGGDGFAIGRIFGIMNIPVNVFYFTEPAQASDDFLINFNRLTNAQFPNVQIEQIGSAEMPDINDAQAIVIDAIFGTGLKRQIDDEPWSQWIDYINELPNSVFSVDLPSGLFADQTTTGNVIEADVTLSFELPKLAFFCPENADIIGDVKIVQIGLDKQHIELKHSYFETIEDDRIASLISNREKFAHKGNFGHILIAAGSKGKMGAAILAGKGALRSGAGKLTMHIPSSGLQIMQTALPEAMANCDQQQTFISEIDHPLEYNSIAIGCGIGIHEKTKQAVSDLFEAKQPITIDADALNILAEDPELLKRLPPKSILTPHLGEFRRLFGSSKNHFERIQLGQKKAQELDIYIILKGAHTMVFTPEKKVYFNTTGNPGMATAGSGDVLAGIIAGLKGQSYTPLDSALIGVYIHGLAGDLAAEKISQESLIASDIIDHMGSAFQQVKHSID